MKRIKYKSSQWSRISLACFSCLFFRWLDNVFSFYIPCFCFHNRPNEMVHALLWATFSLFFFSVYMSEVRRLKYEVCKTSKAIFFKSTATWINSLHENSMNFMQKNRRNQVNKHLSQIPKDVLFIGILLRINIFLIESRFFDFEMPELKIIRLREVKRTRMNFLRSVRCIKRVVDNCLER